MLLRTAALCCVLPWCVLCGCTIVSAPAVFSSPSPATITPVGRGSARGGGPAADGTCGATDAVVGSEPSPAALENAESGSPAGGTTDGDAGATLSPDGTGVESLGEPEAGSGSAGTQGESDPGADSAQRSSLPPSGVGTCGLCYRENGKVVAFPLVYSIATQLLPGLCPAAISVKCEPIFGERREGPVWASAREQTIYVRSPDPEACELEGLEPQLLGNLFKVCLGQETARSDYVFSRDEKGLRFLEEGFAQYLMARPEASALGGRPQAYMNFMEFVSQAEISQGFGFGDFWTRLPTRQELAAPDFTPHPRRLEAQFVAGAFVNDLIEHQGLGVDGYRELWRRIADNPFKIGAEGYAIPEPALEPVLNEFLHQLGVGGVEDIESSWKAFASRILELKFERPRAEIRLEGASLVVSFDQAMLPDWIDITLDEIQLGPERFAMGIGRWSDESTLTIDLDVARAQLGVEEISEVVINEGRVWQWFRSVDGVPARTLRFALPSPN